MIVYCNEYVRSFCSVLCASQKICIMKTGLYDEERNEADQSIL